MRRKAWVFATGAIGLAGALTAAALASPDRAAAAKPTYVPRDAATIVVHVPPRDSREIADRGGLAAAPERVDLAVDLARTEIQRARALADPRYLGRAQATLARWWNLAEPPADVLLLRATIEQSLHQFAAARADLDQLVARTPDDVQAHLTRAVVATVTADYAAARASCSALRRLASPLIAEACDAPLAALTGDADGAYARLAAAITARTPHELRAWALSTLGELAMQRGDDDRAADHLRAVLRIDPDDVYARAALADVLMAREPAEASALLAGFEAIDALLVRRAIAEHRIGGAAADALAAAMRDRFAAAVERDDRVHLREEAMFALGVDGDAAHALELALASWSVQKELADARLVVAAAAAAHRPDAATPVIAWARALGVRDARLADLLAHLEATP